MNAPPSAWRRLLCCAAACWMCASPAVASPPPGTKAPAIELRDLKGQGVSLSALAPRPVVLVFGELDDQSTKTACADVLDVLADKSLAGTDAVPVLIIAHGEPGAPLQDLASRGRFPPTILHDPVREAFGAYEVQVVPTVVVIDGHGAVVHVVHGFLPRFKDLLTESVLVAAGKHTREQLEQVITPKSAAPEQAAMRADQLARFGTELMRRGSLDLAEQRFAEATRLIPGHPEATLGLGEIMLRRNRLDDAEPLFRAALARQPDSVDASLGIVTVQMRRAVPDLNKVEAALNEILKASPTSARAWFLLGQIHELKGDQASAMRDYKKSAELTLDH